MALAFDGTTGYLEHAAKVVSGFPCSFMCWVSSSVPSLAQFWAVQQQSNADRWAGVWHDANGVSIYGSLRNPGGGSLAIQNGSPSPDGTMRLAVAVFTSTTSRKVYFGNSTGSSVDTASVTDDITNHDRFVVGAQHYNSSAATNFLKGSIAEPHIFNVALTSGDVTNLLADSVKPEAITGWVDGWILKTYDGTGNYTSIGGSRVLVASGGVSQSGLAHPISRTTPAPPPPPRIITQAVRRAAVF